MTPPEPDNARELYYDGEGGSEIEQRMQQLERRVALQEEWIRQLWAVNQTWAWSDDAFNDICKARGSVVNQVLASSYQNLPNSIFMLHLDIVGGCQLRCVGCPN